MYSSNAVILTLRAMQFTFAFIMLGLSAFVTNWYVSVVKLTAPSPIGWLLFVSIFTVISIGVVEGLPRFAPRFYHPYAAFCLEIGNALFYFAGFTALAAYMSRLPWCRGSVCGASRADIAFGALEWILWVVSATLAGRELSKKRGLGFRRANNNTQAPLGAPPMKEAPVP